MAPENIAVVENGTPIEFEDELMTIGKRLEAAMYRISHINARPLEEVAVMTRAPADDAPTQALMALCSLSTVTNSVSTSPSAT